MKKYFQHPSLVIVSAIFCFLLFKFSFLAHAEGTGSSDVDPNREYRELVLKLNEFNPLLDAPLSDQKNPSPVKSPEDERLKTLRNWLNNPAVKTYLRWLSNPRLFSSIDRLVHHPKRMFYVYGEAGWFVFFLVFRAWRKSKCKTWYGQLWTSTWTFVLFLGGSFVVLPWMAFGNDFLQSVLPLFFH